METKKYRDPMLTGESWRTLFVSYPLLPVSETSAGGAEQMLWTLEAELFRRGHRTTVAACSGSHVSGELLATGDLPSSPDTFPDREAQHCETVVRWVQEREAEGVGFDIIHDKSTGFWRHASEINAPVLATLHLPRAFYRSEYFDNLSENVFFNCVSRSQLNSFRDLPHLLGYVKNGIVTERFSARKLAPQGSGQNYLLWLGRMCEEKGPHLALDIAYTANQRVIIAGQIYPFLYHQSYFAREIIPRLKRAGTMASFVNSPSFEEKAELLGGASAVLIPSLADESSSLVAMEAAACGTPTIAFARGALPEIVDHGRTGFVVKDEHEMQQAIQEINNINPADCIQHAKANYSAGSMADGYESLYTVLRQGRKSARCAALQQ